MKCQSKDLCNYTWRSITGTDIMKINNKIIYFSPLSLRNVIFSNISLNRLKERAHRALTEKPLDSTIPPDIRNQKCIEKMYLKTTVSVKKFRKHKNPSI